MASTIGIEPAYDGGLAIIPDGDKARTIVIPAKEIGVFIARMMVVGATSDDDVVAFPFVVDQVGSDDIEGDPNFTRDGFEEGSDDAFLLRLIGRTYSDVPFSVKIPATPTVATKIADAIKAVI